MADWTQLPKDLLEQITNRIETSTDLSRFRSVCTSWRSSVVPLPRRSSGTWRVLPNDGISQTSFGFHLSKRTVFLIRLPNSPDQMDPVGWLFKIQEGVSHRKRLLNPLSRYPLNTLPSEFPRVVDLLNFRVFELGHEYVLHHVNYKANLSSGSLYMEKVVVLWLDRDRDYTLLTIHVSGKLALFKSGEKRWSIIQDMPSPYDDVAVHKGEFFAVDNTGRTVVVGSNAELGLVANPVFGGDKKYLVESRGELLLVDVYLSIDTGEGSLGIGEEFLEHLVHYMSERTVRFKVYELDGKGQCWIELKSLGDRVLFIGDDSTFSASASDLSVCKGNSIFFVDNFLCSRDSPTGEDDQAFAGDIGVFEMENGCLGPLGNYPEYSKLFGPPPHWVTLPSLEVQNQTKIQELS